MLPGTKKQNSENHMNSTKDGESLDSFNKEITQDSLYTT